MLSVSPHPVVPSDKPPEDQREASNYDELKSEILDIIMLHDDSDSIIIYSYDGDVQADVDRACLEIKNDDPVGAYALSEITGAATRIVSRFEVEIMPQYQRTKGQLSSVATVSTLPYLRNEMLDAMEQYLDEAVFRTSLRSVTAETVAGLVRELYYQNPRRIVIMPGVVVEEFPENGSDRIVEVRFGNTVLEPGFLRLYGTTLTESIRINAEAAVGDNDAQILLSLAENMMDSVVYDEGRAKRISGHGSEDFAATAYGALEAGSAVGEGFAMAYKALCDELSLGNRVVLGYLDGMVHAWNIVSLYGDNYHVDVSMCAQNGIGTAFLKTDADFSRAGYTWDIENTEKCSGSLTYRDVAVTETLQSPSSAEIAEQSDDTDNQQESEELSS